jgi:hypothetical protein
VSHLFKWNESSWKRRLAVDHQQLNHLSYLAAPSWMSARLARRSTCEAIFFCLLYFMIIVSSPRIDLLVLCLIFLNLLYEGMVDERLS